jgi:hypothetical protein
MVYVNTLMVQQILAQPHWEKRLTARDLHALTPLIWDHVNPYGRFETWRPAWRLTNRFGGW